MNNRRTFWLGVLSFTPILTVIPLLFVVPIVMRRFVLNTNRLPSLSKVYLFFGPINLFIFAVTLGLLAYYIRFALKEMPDSQKRLWILLLMLGTWIVFPIFWYLHIRQARASLA